VRSFLAIGVLGAVVAPLVASAPAAADPLWEAEVRLGFGVALGGGQGQMTTKASPLTIAGVGTIAIQDEPRLAAFGGVILETVGRTSVGGTFGVRLKPGAGDLRLAAGATILAEPYSLYGAMGSIGTCRGLGKAAHLCGDLQLTAYFAGSDLAPDHTVTQAQLVAGVVFDAL
jgi:hypothetical protein